MKAFKWKYFHSYLLDIKFPYFGRIGSNYYYLCIFY